MFAELQPLLANRSFVLILTGTNDGQIRCNFVPKATDKDTEQDRPLLTPLTLTGSAKELDEGLAEAISGYVVAHVSMQESVAATKKQMADAKAEEEAERKAKADAAKNKTKSTVKAVEKTAAAVPTAAGLFDNTIAEAAPANAATIGVLADVANTTADDESGTDENDDEGGAE